MRKRHSRYDNARRNRRRNIDKERSSKKREVIRYNPYPKTVAGTRGGIILVGVAMLLFSFYLILTLFNVQIIKHDEYVKDAAVLRYSKVPVYPERGAIYDSTGLPLAITTYDYTVGFTPRSLRSWISDANAPKAAELATEIASILGIEQEKMNEYMQDEEASYIQLKSKVDAETIAKLRTFLSEKDAFGVVIDPVMRRNYPAKDIAASVLGFASKMGDNISGVMGVEAYYDSDLSGKPGYSYRQIDNYSGRELPFTEGTDQALVQPFNLKLNLNSRLQAYCQKLAKQYAEAYSAQNGAEIIVMDPNTGAVLAMANHNSFNLNEPYATPEGKDPKTWNPFENKEEMDFLFDEYWKNRSTQALYEAGSTYKALTVAMAKEENIYQEEQLFDDSPIWVEGFDAYPISCWSGGGHGMETVRMALIRSCNPVMVQLAETMGMEKFYEYARAFGHQEKTGIDLPAESNPWLHPEATRMQIDLANLSFGESSVITPLHLINAVATIANGGLLMKPQVVDSYVDDKGVVVKDIKPEVVRRVISKETADTVLSYMRDLVTYTYDGTPEGETPGYYSAGKTSTSNHGDNDYLKDISFVNIAPYDKPKVIVLAVLHEPASSTFSLTTAKMSAQAANYALEQLGVPKQADRDLNELFWQRYVPDLSGYSYQSVGKVTLPNGILLDKELNAPKDATVKYQYPNPAELINNRGTIYVSHTGKPMTELATVPSFEKMGFEAAYKLAEEMGLNLLVQGNPEGKVTEQSIEAGKTVLKYSIVKLWLS